MTEGLEAIAVDSFLPDVMSRYRQLLFPVLRLCMAVLTSLGSQHKEAASQVKMIFKLSVESEKGAISIDFVHW